MPAIWEKWDEFSKNLAKLKKAASDLADAAKAKDEKIGEMAAPENSLNRQPGKADD